MPAVAAAQPGVDVQVGVGGDDNYDTTAPGDPVESVDVFYDQLSPYGTWVDDPDAGRVFIPDQNGFVPYTTGHWQYTSLGFVWVSSEPFGWATSHYGRWGYSNEYGRWIWSPDTQWGPAWVDWRQDGTHFGWAPMAPDAYVRIGYAAPIESWRYCGSDHILDVNVTRYYEPRDRVIAIHREARPIEHYSNVSNVRVVVGPGAAVLREHRVVTRPVKVEARTIGRWTPTEAHAQVTRAQEHKTTFEAQNQHRIDGNVKIRTVQTKVVETHPEIKVKVNARAEVVAHPAAHNEVAHPTPPEHGAQHVEPTHAAPPAHTEPTHAAPPAHVEPAHTAPPAHAEPTHTAPPAHVEPAHTAPPAHVEPTHAAPPAHVEPTHAAPPAHAEPTHAAPPAHTEPTHAAPPAATKHEEPKHEEHH